MVNREDWVPVSSSEASEQLNSDYFAVVRPGTDLLDYGDLSRIVLLASPETGDDPGRWWPEEVFDSVERMHAHDFGRYPAPLVTVVGRGSAVDRLHVSDLHYDCGVSLMEEKVNWADEMNKVFDGAPVPNKTRVSGLVVAQEVERADSNSRSNEERTSKLSIFLMQELGKLGVTDRVVPVIVGLNKGERSSTNSLTREETVAVWEREFTTQREPVDELIQEIGGEFGRGSWISRYMSAWLPASRVNRVADSEYVSHIDLPPMYYGE